MSRSIAVIVLLAGVALSAAACLPTSIRESPTPAATATPSPTVPTPTPTPAPPTPMPSPTFALHTVVRGDTLTSLARTYHTTARSIAYWNRAKYPSLDPESDKYNPDGLQRGWVLQVMPGEEYTPPAGDGETGEQVTPSPDDSVDDGPSRPTRPGRPMRPRAHARCARRVRVARRLVGGLRQGTALGRGTAILTRMSPAAGRSPRILVTMMVAGSQPDPAVAARKNALYVDSVLRHGATAMAIDATASAAQRAGALASMDGLLLTGGADLHPARYGAEDAGSEAVQHDRDELEAAAFAAADARGLPVLGICRGLQAMNVFSGGTLLQHIDGHAGPGWGHGPALTHPLRLVPGTRFARILAPTNVGGGVLTVNSYHHQAVLPANLAPGYVPAAWSPSPSGDVVEAFEAPEGPFRMAVQCHPERTESTPKAFERLFAFFVDACRGPLAER